MHHDLSNRITLHRQTISEISLSMRSCIDIAENMEIYELHDRVEEQRELMKSYVVMENDFLDRISLLEKVRSGTITATNEESISEVVVSQTGQLQKKRDLEAFKSHPKFKEFEQKVWHVNHPDEMRSDDEEEGILLVSQQVDIRCPLTKLPFENPVRNSCGHTYEKEAIVETITQDKSKRRATKCPVSGCGRFVTKISALVVDTAMLEAVKNHKKEMESQRGEVDEEIVRL